MTTQQDDPNATPGSQPDDPRPPTFEQRVEGFGRETEAAARRLSSDPAVGGAFDAAGLAFGLIVLAVGLWFFADVTLGMTLPRIPWRDLWPLVLIVVGLAVLFRGVARRT